MTKDTRMIEHRAAGFFVVDGADDGAATLAGPFATNAEAWQWIDRHSERRRRVPYTRSVGARRRRSAA